jgi:hypothetical protein
MRNLRDKTKFEVIREVELDNQRFAMLRRESIAIGTLEDEMPSIISKIMQAVTRQRMDFWEGVHTLFDLDPVEKEALESGEMVAEINWMRKTVALKRIVMEEPPR